MNGSRQIVMIELSKILEEVKKVYNLSESDVVCMTMLLLAVKSSGLSQEHATRLLKPLTFLMEEIIRIDNEQSKP